MKNPKLEKVQLRFETTPVHKTMSTRSLKLLMTMLRKKNYLCFPRLDDKKIKIKEVENVFILKPNKFKDGLAVHAHKKLGKWSVWHVEDSFIFGKW